MPTRLLRDYTDSFRLERVSAEGERLFVRLIQKADDFGRFHADPRLVRSACFPLVAGVTEKDVSRWLDEITHAGLILRYEVRGRPYLAILEFRQRLRQMEGKFPAPDGEPKDWQALRGGVAVDGQLTGNGPSTDGLSRVEEKRVEVEVNTPGKPANSPSPASKKKKEEPVSTPPEQAEVVAFVRDELKLPASDGEFLFLHWQENGFTRDGKPIRDWRLTANKWKAGGWLPSQKVGARNGASAFNGTARREPDTAPGDAKASTSSPMPADFPAFAATRSEFRDGPGAFGSWRRVWAKCGWARDDYENRRTNHVTPAANNP